FEERARVRRSALFAIGYVALLSYHGGVVLLPFHVAGGIALALLDRRQLAPGQVFEPLITAAGGAAGLTLNPHMDAPASDRRLFSLHVGDMGRDTAHLYDDLDIAEFHGFPLRVILLHPEWLVLLAATVIAVLVVLGRAIVRPNPASRAAIVLAGMAIAGIVLT